MNKYVLRTSLVWIAVLGVLAGIWAYRSHRAMQPVAMNMPMSGDGQPVATGPSPGTKMESSIPEQKMETPLVPVQLTPERMQSIGVKIGTVEYKQLSDDIRATGTVDIN
ncbi:MAG: efflux RND transporter periplasmic adaptor subunit, partial [Acidobacteriales bacterium]|nr:efflux RND transporter periplasmic adaptor subunit [Terriglobales bacterium]